MKENRRNEGRVGGNQKLNLCMGIKLNLCKKNLHHKSKWRLFKIKYGLMQKRQEKRDEL